MATQSIMSPTTTIEALNRTLQTAPLDPVILAIANDYLSGKDIDTIAEEYGISTDRVTSALDKKEVKNYVDSVFATQGYLNRVKRINLINRVIDQKLEEAMETGIYSKKDLLDWMKIMKFMLRPIISKVCSRGEESRLWYTEVTCLIQSVHLE